MSPRAAVTGAARHAGSRVRAFLRGIPRALRVPVALGGAAVLVLGGAGIAWAAGSVTSTDYVTATAGTGSVDEQLALTGTIASATRSDVSFPVAGTVATVDVVVGQTVAAGDLLATLELSELQDAVDSAEEAVARAEEQLDSDLSGQTSSSTSGGGNSGSSTGSSTSAAAASDDDALADEIAAVAAAQQTLLDLLDAADESLVAAHTASDDAATACQPFLDATLPDDPSTFDAAALEAIQALLTICQTAATGTLDAADIAAAAQDAASAAMDALDEAVTALQTAATELAASSGSAGDPAGTGGSASGAASAASGSVGGGGSSGSTASAADIVADRAAISAAEADLAIAQAALGASDLVSPIAGTVAQVALSVGDSVTAGSTTAVVTVIGDDGYVVETTVTLAQLQKLAVGQTGEAIVTSSGSRYTATVAAIGFVNVATDSSTPSYAVTIAVDPGEDVLLNGAAVALEIGVAAASDVTVVPISAITLSDTGATVLVLAGGTVEIRTVELGALGDEYAEIVEGLEPGEVVVLADASAAIPSSTDESTTSGLSGIGGSTQTGPGGGAPPSGGFQGGPPTR